MKQIIELQYFGCINAFVTLYNATHIILEQYETFQKMSFRNRCQILGSGKVIDLSIPLIGGRDQKAFSKDILIDNSQNWQQNHWRTLESCYNKSAFFEHYAPTLQALLFGKQDKLWQLNEAALRWVLQCLKWQGTISLSEKFEKKMTNEVVDSRNIYRPANRLSVQIPPYQQVFGSAFEPNLSILDLLFNLGPQAAGYLKNGH